MKRELVLKGLIISLLECLHARPLGMFIHFTTGIIPLHSIPASSPSVRATQLNPFRRHAIPFVLMFTPQLSTIEGSLLVNHLLPHRSRFNGPPLSRTAAGQAWSIATTPGLPYSSPTSGCPLLATGSAGMWVVSWAPAADNLWQIVAWEQTGFARVRQSVTVRV